MGKTVLPPAVTSLPDQGDRVHALGDSQSDERRALTPVTRKTHDSSPALRPRAAKMVPRGETSCPSCLGQVLWHLLWAPAWALTYPAESSQASLLGWAMETWEWNGTGPLCSPHRPSPALLSLCSPFVPSLSTLLSSLLFWNLLQWPLPLAAVFAFASSPLGLWGQSARTTAGYSWPSWSGLPSGTESFLRGATVTHPLWCPPWWWAGFTWSRPKRTLTAEHPLPPMSGQGLGAVIGFHFFVTLITHGT